MNSEIYIWLGRQFDTHFFIHSIYSDEFDKNPEISHQIYNILINDNFIESEKENVIIYEISKNNLVDIIVIQHCKSETYIKFDKENLETFFKNLINAERREYYCIKYLYDFNRYESYVLDKFVLNPSKIKDIDTIEIKEIIEVITTKSVNQ